MPYQGKDVRGEPNLIESSIQLMMMSSCEVYRMMLGHSFEATVEKYCWRGYDALAIIKINQQKNSLMIYDSLMLQKARRDK